MEGQAAAAAAISAVLDDDDLLSEILVRVAFPTSLVRAALVTSAPVFLRRFRDLHPPHLLGFYAITTYTKPPRFVPIPQPPELASVVRRASFDLDTMGTDRLDVDYCWNGLLLITFGRHRGVFASYKTSVHYPLYPRRHASILPPLPATSIHDGFTYYSREIIPSRRRSDDGTPYFCLAQGCKEQQSALEVYVLQDDTTWVIYSSAIAEIPRIQLLLPDSLIADDRIYNLARVSTTTFKLFSLDLSSSSLSLVDLPEEEMQLLRADLVLENDSELHLIYVKGSQLRNWLYMVDNDGAVNWLLVNTICLHGICANHMIPTRIFENVGVSSLVVYAAGLNSGLLFLEKDEVLYLFDIKSKTAKKVFEVTQEGVYLHQIRPFMMVWPPKFPVITEEGVIQKNDVPASQSSCDHSTPMRTDILAQPSKTSPGPVTRSQSARIPSTPMRTDTFAQPAISPGPVTRSQSALFGDGGSQLASTASPARTPTKSKIRTAKKITPKKRRIN